MTGDTETQACLNCQIILKHMERWCKNWGIAVSGDKKSTIYLNTENTHAPKFFGETGKVTRNTKIPGFDCGQQTEFQRTYTAGRRESC